MIDIRQMRYFAALAETLHFGRAAERLHVTQPPLSRQIAALERELGVKLLERHSRQAALTRAGRRFLEDSRTVLAAFDQACRNAVLAERGELGELSIGFMMHAAFTVVPSLTRRYITAYPEIELGPARCRARWSTDPGGSMSASCPAGAWLETWPVHRSLCAALPAAHPLAGRDGSSLGIAAALGMDRAEALSSRLAAGQP